MHNALAAGRRRAGGAPGKQGPASTLPPSAAARGATGAPGHPGRAGRVLMLALSSGLGGGIERYLDTLEWAFAAHGTACQRVNLSGGGMAGAAQMLAAGRAALRSGTEPTRLVVGHRALLPVAALLAREPTVSGTSVLCYGNDAWQARYQPRRVLERRLMRRPGVRAVAISGFTAGALALDRPATVLPPALSADWFATLAGAAREAAGSANPGSDPRNPRMPGTDGGARLATAFRLEDWRDKGLPELVNAVAMLGLPGVHLNVCGSGVPPPGVLRLVRHHPWCALRTGLTDRELAAEFAAADLFVLATRTRAGRRAYGEGFGFVLLEAQAAGTPVIVPAHGGSHDAYVEGITGAAPADETAESLATVLRELLADPDRLGRMGRRAAQWVAETFDPGRYPDLVARRLL